MQDDAKRAPVVLKNPPKMVKFVLAIIVYKVRPMTRDNVIMTA